MPRRSLWAASTGRKHMPGAEVLRHENVLAAVNLQVFSYSAETRVSLLLLLSVAAH